MKNISPIVSFASVLLLGQALAGQASPQAVTLFARTNIAGAGQSSAPVLSADGRVVAFVSNARNLVTNDNAVPFLNVYVRDLAANTTTLVSVNSSGIGGGNDDANYPSLSSNGQFLAFASRASNLVSGDTNDACDVFVRDLRSGVTTLVSVDVTGTDGALGPAKYSKYPLESSYPLISADGRWVAFQSSASNLVALPDTNRAPDVFIRDLQANVTYLVSLNATGTGSGNDKAELESMTSDGRFVAFTTKATDLAAGSSGSEELYVRDLQAQTTHWVSVNVAQSLPQPFRASHAVLSQDGRYVAFKAETGSGTTPQVAVFRHDLQTGATLMLSSNSIAGTAPCLSADGRYVGYESDSQIYLRDTELGVSRLVTVNFVDDAPASGWASAPVLTLDGARLAFVFTCYDPEVDRLTPDMVNTVGQLYIYDLASRTTQLVSRRRDGSATPYDLQGTVPVLSPSGGQVFFESPDDNLVDADLNGASDVFCWDLATRMTTLLSECQAQQLAQTGTGLSSLAGISANGAAVVFTSLDNNLVAGDTNRNQDVFACNLGTGTVTILNPGSDHNSVGGAPQISANGRYVTFMKRANLGRYEATYTVHRQDLLTGMDEIVAAVGDMQEVPVSDLRPFLFTPSPMSADGNLVVFQTSVAPPGFASAYDYMIFLRDMATGRFGLISRSTNGSTAYGISPVLSPDSRWVLFQSNAQNISTNPVPYNPYQFPYYQLYALEWQTTNSARLLSFDPSGAGMKDYAMDAVFSANSRYVAFYTASNRVVYRHDLDLNRNVAVCTNCQNPSLSGDGRWVAYEAHRDGSALNDIYVRDLETGETRLVTANRLGTGGGNGSSSCPQISYDGRYVVFASRASDLVDNDNNAFTDVFVWDRLRGTTTLLSLNRQGTGAGNGPSGHPVLSADGRTVVFQSFAGDLCLGDYNNTRDIFVVRLGAPDTDGDGLDDDWELAYFGNLSRDGTGDFDGDGQTDLQEYQAGTDPTNRGAVLRAITVTQAGSGRVNVLWTAVPGKTYRVQFKDQVNDPGWTDLPGTVTAGGTSASLLDLSAPATQRFYRVVVVP